MGLGVATLWPALWRWLMWGVVLGALAPVLLLFVVESVVDGRWASLYLVAGHGELFLIAGLLVVGDLEGLRRKPGKMAEFIHGLAICVVLGSLVSWSAVVAEEIKFPEKPHYIAALQHVSLYGGMVVLALALVCGGVNRSLGQPEKEAA